MKTIEQLQEQREKLIAKNVDIKSKVAKIDAEIEDMKSREAREKINSLDLDEKQYRALIAFLSKENKDNVLLTIEKFKESEGIAASDKGDEE